MPQSTRELEIDDVDFEVTFEWDQDDYDGRHFFEYLVRVEHRGEDIMHLLSEKVIEEIENKIEKNER
jgi:hypothetical protein